jgi:hypothetical protein
LTGSDGDRVRALVFSRANTMVRLSSPRVTFYMMVVQRRAGREGTMDELIARLVANVGVERAAAEQAVGVIFDFLLKEGPADKVQALIARLPGAEELLKTEESSGGGFAMGGLMGAGAKMMAAGLSMDQVQGVTREVIAYAREKAGDEAIGEIVGAIPGLSQFV